MTQSDLSSFISYTANGAFIANQISFTASTKALPSFVKTLMVSQALQSHNAILMVARNFNNYDLSRKNFIQSENGTMLPPNSWHVNCQNEPDIYSNCDNWWIDNPTNDAYALFKLDDMEHNFFELMEATFSFGWTSGEDLYVGARDYKALLNAIATNMG